MKSHYKPRPAGSLKDVTTLLIAAVGGLDRAADITGKRPSTIQRYGDHAAPDRWMDVRDVRLLERFAGQPVITRYLANEMGWILLNLEPEPGAGLETDFAAFGEKAASLFADYHKALTDEQTPGQIDPAEARKLLADCDKVLRVLATMRADLAGKFR